MTTVAQFIEYLSTLPPETKVEAVEVYSGEWCQESQMTELDLDRYSDNLQLYGDTLYIGKE